jgi:hypothetical protein
LDALPLSAWSWGSCLIRDSKLGSRRNLPSFFTHRHWCFDILGKMYNRIKMRLGLLTKLEN